MLIFCYLFVVVCLFFFFFKQKSAYEMRISDWSSDVCSSDLIKVAEADTAVEARTVEVGTALAWINLAYAERRLAALDDVLSQLERVVGTTPGAVASGNARPAQTLAGRQAVATMQDRRSELVSNVARARATLTRWTGDPTPEIADRKSTR